jgi:ubiquinone/menaquinone biosynthesis C-methylase UbiE
MLFEKFVARQLRHPSGIFSGYVARQMNRTNANMNKTTVQLLEIKPTDRVLEIGFGGGAALDEMAKLVESGLLAGVDVSDAMLKRGSKRFRRFISQGKMELKKSSSAKIPYEDGFFDKACAVNCIYFWPNPVADLKEIRRVLKQNGVLIIAVVVKEELEKTPAARHGFLIYSDDQIKNLLSDAGFADVRIERREVQPHTATYAIATKL